MNEKTDQLLGDVGDVVAGLTRTIDEVMPLAQCLGVLCEYLKKNPEWSLCFEPNRQSFAFVSACRSIFQVLGVKSYTENTPEHILLEALNNWFAKEDKKS